MLELLVKLGQSVVLNQGNRLQDGTAGTRHRYGEAGGAPWFGIHIPDHVYVLAFPSSTPFLIVVFKSPTHPRMSDYHTSDSTLSIKSARKDQN